MSLRLANETDLPAPVECDRCQQRCDPDMTLDVGQVVNPFGPSPVTPSRLRYCVGCSRSWREWMRAGNPAPRSS